MFPSATAQSDPRAMFAKELGVRKRVGDLSEQHDARAKRLCLQFGPRARNDKSALGELAEIIAPSKILRLVTSPEKKFYSAMDESTTDAYQMNCLTRIIFKVVHYGELQEKLFELLNYIRGSNFLKQQILVYFRDIRFETCPKVLSTYEEITIHTLEMFRVLLQRLPSSADDIFTALTIMQSTATSLKDERVEMQTRVAEIQQLFEECQGIIATRRKKQFAIESNIRPPNNFRSISVFPTAADIHRRQRPFLRPIKKEGAYVDLEDYLDIQFRLMREDYLQPLVNGIKSYKKALRNGTQERNSDIRIYKPVTLLFQVCNNDGLCYRIELNMPNLKKIQWQHTKRLMFGTLLCLTNDDFTEDFIFATVTNRDVKLLEKGQMEIRIENAVRPFDDFNLQLDLVMVESTTFFEPYRHVLEGLQQIDNMYPFQEYLVGCEKEVNLPRYVQNNSNKPFDFSSCFSGALNEPVHDMDTVLDLLQPKHGMVKLTDFSTWPSNTELELDDTQYLAFKAALTREVALIQGPPGTGKTYVGLKIVKALLSNSSFMKVGHTLQLTPGIIRAERRKPILVVCYTNHALDQFLEGIRPFCPDGIVRVGGRSKSEILQDRNLKELRFLRRTSGLGNSVSLGRARRRLKELQNHMRVISIEVEVCDRGVLHEIALENVISQDHLESLQMNKPYSCKYAITSWLEVDNLSQYRDARFIKVQTENNTTKRDCRRQTDFYSQRDRHMVDIDEYDLEEIEQIKPGEIDVNGFGLALFVGDDFYKEGGNSQWKVENKHHYQWIKSQLGQTTTDTYNSEPNIYRLSLRERWKLYRYWRSRYRQNLERRKTQCENEYRSSLQELSELQQKGDKAIMEEAQVLGMTTTAAAKLRYTLQAIGPTIVIIEEAAEILEAHIISTLSSKCQHVILIGDHQQLRPNPAVYELAEKYNLKISLFERFVNNGMDCITLGEQHRMRPEISALLQHIYPTLRDHESVKTLESIQGLQTTYFFLNHNEPETKHEELISKSNLHEANVIGRLCQYLLQQGYEAAKITILTAYSGQVMLLKKTLPKNRFDGIKITAIDNYQGEENDIILLSLVRSNTESKIGFLKDDNRLCVTLSRAKKGLYAIGNFDLLKQESKLWAKMITTAENAKCYGNSLPLYCHNHPNDSGISVQSVKDFDKVPEGGCMKPCEFRLLCGHVCTRLCHNYDKDHTYYKCNKPCQKSICDVHKTTCKLVCYQRCQPCEVLTDKVLYCMHVRNLPCNIEVQSVRCQEPCARKLLCGHLCAKTCSELCTTICIGLKKIELQCGHVVEVRCDQSKIDLLCNKPCTLTLKCGHRCEGTCAGCFSGRLHQSCKSKCTRILVCGHKCQDFCSHDCPPCTKRCENRCGHSRCSQKCGQPCVPCKEPCEWKCSHTKCTKLCHEPCDREKCNNPCNKLLPCLHKCIGLCGETCPTKCRICQEEDVSDIFFGTEVQDGTDAIQPRFVQLHDCPHMFEASALDTWMDQNVESDQNMNIQMKKCPKCSTLIRRNLRYGTVIKQQLSDIEKVKQKTQIGTENDLSTLTRHLLRHTSDKEFCKLLQSDINYHQMRCLQIVIPLIDHIVTKVREQPRMPQQSQIVSDIYPINVVPGYKNLQRWAKRTRRRLSEQECQEAQDEISRLDCFNEVNFVLHKVVTREVRLSDEMEQKLVQIKSLYTGGKRMTLEMRDLLSEVTTTITKQLDGVLGISEQEKFQVLQWGESVGLRKGSWYKCPNGHIYVIGECGGAMQQSQCPECKTLIGGTAHKLEDGNTVATIMDGARHAAWSEQANLENYNLDNLL